MKDYRLNLYKSLFKGREDVFALRWEKGGKSSYMPSYSFDPHRYRLHQMKGGTFQTFADKSYQALTEEHLIKHLKGEQVVGLYPLLPDNKSWFIAADFDEADWIEECRTFIKICEKMISQPTLSAHVPAKAAMFGYFLKNPMKHSEAEK